MDATIFGLIVADLVAEPLGLHGKDDLPEPGGLRLLRSLQLTTGGNVCNTGIAMAKLGMRVAAAGMVGADALGRTMIDGLNRHGLDTSAVTESADAQTSATVVAVAPGGERCFFHVPGVTARLDADTFRRCFSAFTRASWLQIGYFGLLPALTPELPTLLREFRATAPGTRIALDTVNPPASRELLDPILPYVDLFAPSRTEAQALTGEKSPKRMTDSFRAHLPEGALIGIKLDAKGCYLDDGKQRLEVPAYKVKVVDTTGAGDTWFAGLLTGLRKGLPLEQCGRLANRAAADCCTMLGASAGVRSYEDTMARL